MATLVMAFVFAACIAVFGLAIWYSRRAGNAAIIKDGISGEAVIDECRIDASGRRHVTTYVTYTFQPQGHDQPLTVTKHVQGPLRLAQGSRVPIKYLRKHPSVSVLLPYADRHDGF